MNTDKLHQAMEHISDRHLAEAVTPEDCCEPRKTPASHRRFGAVAAIAAMLTVILLAVSMLPGNFAPLPMEEPDMTAPSPAQPHVTPQKPGSVPLAGLLVGPSYPQIVQYPQDPEDYAALQLWAEDQRALYSQPKGYADSLTDFFQSSLPRLLAAGEGNPVCSPINIYSALAMLAECTGGNSRQQLLALLGAESLEALREQAGQVWNAHYRFDGRSTTVLGSSLWLKEGLTYDPDTVSRLADSYYASVFQGQLGSEEMNRALQDWLNDQTGGLLKEQVSQQKFDPSTVLGLSTTIFYRAGWAEEFSEANTTLDTFHTPSGDLQVPFMRKTISFGTLYEGDDYSAIRLSMADDSKMWLILPAQGKTPSDVLSSGKAVAMILSGSDMRMQEAQIRLSLPRFDVSGKMDLKPVLKALGITDVFSDTASDFTPILPGSSELVLGTADHAARVAIDEEGVVAAAYTVMLLAPSSAPSLPGKTIDFVLDRPFLFLIQSKDGLPTFAGIVNTPDQTAAPSDAPPEEPVPSETPQEEPDLADPVSDLTPDELAQLARLFAVTTDDNGIAQIPYYNTCLLSTFDSPENVDLSILFANGVGENGPLTQAEQAHLEGLNADLALDVQRISISDADAVLQKLFGIGWEDTNLTGIERLYRSQSLGCCYRVSGGVTVAENLVFHSGTRQDDLIRLYYTIGGAKREITLRETDAGLLIVSNLPQS